MTIREEEIRDYKSVEDMVKSAFEKAEHTDGNEHNLVQRLRKSNGLSKNFPLWQKKIIKL